MCGIAGLSLSKRDAQNIDRLRLVQALLGEIESRGRDASGICWRSAVTGSSWWQKENIPGRQFARRIDPDVRNAGAVICHTRWATQGDPAQNENNHPVVLPGVTGVHNGVIRNDDEVFDLLDVERTAKVDSEALFALIAYRHLLDVEDDRSQSFADLFGLLTGSLAAAWIVTNEERPSLWLARGASSPLFIGWTRGGSLIFASTRIAIQRASIAAGSPVGKIEAVREGTLLRVAGGRVQERWTFTPEGAGVKSRHNYNVRSRFEEQAQTIPDEFSESFADWDDDEIDEWIAAQEQDRIERRGEYDSVEREYRHFPKHPERSGRWLDSTRLDVVDHQSDRANRRGELLFGSKSKKNRKAAQ